MSWFREARSHHCGELNEENIDSNVVLKGWVDTRRDHGGLIFVDLRDRYGITQIVLNPAEAQQAKDLRNEFVIAVEGKVRKRPEGMENAKMSTGAIEVEALQCQVLSEAKTPPIQINDDQVTENLKLKYRYLDLRSKKMQNNLITRHKLNQIIRKALDAKDFLEIETPILYKSTPEGARDYLVPSRIHPGKFYALPQSPQTLKQLLMIAGYDKYFQIARCFRDEDLRAERQPEFTQLDLEMSFTDEAQIRELNEELFRKIWRDLKSQEITDFPIMTYQEAMNTYGNDKPDLRFGLKLYDLKDKVKDTEFRVFADAVKNDAMAIKGFAVAKAAAMTSRGKIDKLTDLTKKAGAKGMVWIKWEEGGKASSPVNKFFSEDQLKDIVTACGGGEGDLALLVADEWATCCAALSTLRLHLGREMNLIDESQDRFLWVTEFPLLEYDPDAKRWVAMHHPFTAVSDEQREILIQGQEDDFSKLKAKAYDLVCNGYEIAGGSIRIHEKEMQDAMFRALRIEEKEAQERFGFFLEALQYGTPPHGGIAWGIDRISMILCNTEAIRDVIAFPKTAKAFDAMSDAPSIVDREQLHELGIQLRPSVKPT